MPALINIIGHRYARLIVISIAGRKKGRQLWLCRCDCGNEITIGANALRQGNTKSCGCFKLERASQWGAKNRTHGESQCGSRDGRPSREYRAWMGMRERCLNPNDKNFANYGGRGIAMCARWLNSYEHFLADMGRCPAGCSLDRINNDGPYACENCRWATSSEQNKNRRLLMRSSNGKYAAKVADRLEVS